MTVPSFRGRKMMKIASVGSEGAPDVGPNGKYRLKYSWRFPASFPMPTLEKKENNEWKP